MAVCHHLGFLKLQIFTGQNAEVGQTAKLRHRAKFRRNRSNCGRYIVIFRFSKMAAAAILDFKIFEILTVGTRNHVLDGVQIPVGMGNFDREKDRPIVKHRKYYPCAAAMRPVVKLL